MSHDRQAYTVDGLIFRDANGRTQSLQRNILGIWEWVDFTLDNIGDAHRIDLVDEGFVQLYNPSAEQYMTKADYDQMRKAEGGFNDESTSAFTRADSEFARETHRRVSEWDKPLEEHERTPGNVLWRETVDRIAARAQAEHDAAMDEERFARGVA